MASRRLRARSRRFLHSRSTPGRAVLSASIWSAYLSLGDIQFTR